MSQGAFQGDKEPLKATFRASDPHGDRHMTYDELRRLLRNLVDSPQNSIVVTDNEIDELLNECPKSYDDRYDVLKFIDHIWIEIERNNKAKRQALGATGAHEQKQKSRESALRHAFEKFDPEQKGGISILSFSAMLKAGGHAIIDRMPICEAISTTFDWNSNSKLEFEEFCKLVSALEEGRLLGLPKTNVLKLSQQLLGVKEPMIAKATENVDQGPTTVDIERPSTSSPSLMNESARNAILKSAFEVFAAEKQGVIYVADMASRLKVAAHLMIDQFPVAETISKSFDWNDNAQLEFNEFTKLSEELKKGAVPGIPKIDVVEVARSLT